ncbi:DJ-1/PfpI family protein [Demequina activiva]|uniref:Glutamine amidotransferase n=1 Tax=Demequina activiva TaxID=1582364 RepID=A0A919ULQ9_9MICO|nr:DJ-1/PfpI family protein [Demequina activiva]GIG54958.1 glutamine amidotransferase [Demequina activiva]
MARIGILVFDGFDLIDAGGPYEVFLTASRLAERDGRAATFSVELLSPGGADVTAFGGMTLTALSAAEDASGFDVVVVPGTIDVDAALADHAVRAAVGALAAAGELTTSVCTGAFLLAQHGILDGLPATTHWEDVAALRSAGVDGALSDVRWADAGDVITSGGLTSGLHMALHVVARLEGAEMARRTARQLDMDWSEDPAR